MVLAPRRHDLPRQCRTLPGRSSLGELARKKVLQPLELIKTSKSSYSPAFHHSNTGMLEQNKTLLDFWALARWSSNLLHRCLRLGGSASFVLERDIEQDGAGTRCTVSRRIASTLRRRRRLLWLHAVVAWTSTQGSTFCHWPWWRKGLAKPGAVDRLANTLLVPVQNPLSQGFLACVLHSRPASSQLTVDCRR